MKKLGCLFVGVSIVLSSPVYSGAFDFDIEKPNVFRYTYLEGGYLSRDADFDGFGISGSFDIKPNVSIIGSFSSTSADVFGVSVDFNAFSIGAAHHYKFDNQTLPNTDISLHAEYINYKVEVPFLGGTASNDESGFRVGVKGRYQLNTDLELSADVSIETADVNDLVITPGLAYTLADNFSVVGTYELISDTDTLTISGRLYF